jgi:hypothetical protein
LVEEWLESAAAEWVIVLVKDWAVEWEEASGVESAVA